MCMCNIQRDRQVFFKNNFKQANKEIEWNATEMLHASHSNYQQANGFPEEATGERLQKRAASLFLQ